MDEDRRSVSEDEATGRGSARGLVLAGTGLFAMLGLATVALNLAFGEAVYAERLISGLAGCL